MMRWLGILLALVSTGLGVEEEVDFDSEIRPLLSQHCVSCHGKTKTKGKTDLFALRSREAFLAHPELVRNVIDAVDSYDMPPDSEPELGDQKRERLLAWLQGVLVESTAKGTAASRLPLHRLNRFQYNHAVRDLFELDRDLFALPERLLVRHEDYLDPVPEQMPDKVEVSCESLSPKGGMRGLDPFPKDLQAEHGYDNQADHLTLPPLLLDAMFDLSASIFSSPDFTPQAVGMWDRYFAPPDSTDDLFEEISQRIEHVCRRAFRGPVEPETVQRYADFVHRKSNSVGFERAMKEGMAAILASPRFLFRVWESSPQEEHAAYALASRLSFGLWGSGPDDDLLKLAESGELLESAILERTVRNMMSNPKVSRLLDSFPAQWMQLESILSAAPDKGQHPLFHVGKEPASMQMVVEPLLLFESAFLENRPLHQLIDPEYSYRNAFLEAWYEDELAPKTVDPEVVRKKNEALLRKRRQLRAEAATHLDRLEALTGNAKQAAATLLHAKAKPDVSRLNPFAEWDFTQGLEDRIGSLDLKAHGDVEVSVPGSGAVLNGGFLQSPRIERMLKERSLEVWLRIPSVGKAGGGAMAVSNHAWSNREVISFGRGRPDQWSIHCDEVKFRMVPELVPEDIDAEEPKLVQMVLTRDAKGTLTLYRNGRPYDGPYKARARTLVLEARVSFGRMARHENPESHFAGTLQRARMYEHALSPAEVYASYHLDTSGRLDARPASDVAIQKVVTSFGEVQHALATQPVLAEAAILQKQENQTFEADLRNKMKPVYRRIPVDSPRYSGIVANSAVLTMTSGSERTHPITRGAWLTEVVFNDPPPPPPNNVPALDESVADKSLTIRERFARHRDNPDCAACHARLDPLGFALENFDEVGRWRERYPNKRDVDPSGTLLKQDFKAFEEFKGVLVAEKERFAKGFTTHFARFYLGREIAAADTIEIERIVDANRDNGFRIKDLMLEVCLSPVFSAPEASR